MDAVAFIFARGGSKGLPGKNVKPLAGKPLIAWAIEQAQKVKRINRVIVSTDSDEIAAVARDFGAEVPFLRPEHLARDESAEWDAWRHALTFVDETEGRLPGTFVSVPATAPMRLPEDIDACLDDFARGGADVVVAMTEAHRSPWFNMVRRREDGTCVPVNAPVAGIVRRQDAPPVFDLTTIAYVADPHFVLDRPSLFAGRMRGVVVPAERAVDIDTPHDFEIADFLMRKRLAAQ